MMMTEQEKHILFEQLVHDNERLIKYIIFIHCPSVQWAKDVYQEVLLNIWKSLDSFKGNANINTYIYRIAFNISILFSKKHCNFDNKIDSCLLYEYENFTGSNADNNEYLQLYFLIDQLNTIDRNIMLLYLEEYTHAEIADIIGISVSNVGTKISRIIKKMKSKNKNDTGI